jgi:uridine kinase
MQSPDYMRRWMQKGASFDDLSAPGLADDMVRMKRGEAIIDPGTGAVIPPGKWIIFEMPLGREYSATAGFIDLLIWIDTPLDMALARKIREFISHSPPASGEKDTRSFLSWLDNYLDNYLNLVGKMLVIQRDHVSIHADVILDGRNDLDTMVRLAIEAIRDRFPR